MAFNAWINVGDIKGESTDKDHKDWIMVTECSSDVPRASRVHALKITVPHGTGAPLRMRLTKGRYFAEVILDRSLADCRGAHSPEVIEGRSLAASRGTQIPDRVAQWNAATGGATGLYWRERLLGVKVADIDVTPAADTFTLQFAQKLEGYGYQKPDGTGAGN
jgi:type VI protein secretion system component Hcp